MAIGGNITAFFQTKEIQLDEMGDVIKNAMGEAVLSWVEVGSTTGWLGLQTGDSKYSNFNAKIEESSHVFLCDYNENIYKLSLPDEKGKARNSRVLIKGMVYDVLLIDNPDEMNEQLEVYLRKVGAING